VTGGPVRTGAWLKRLLSFTAKLVVTVAVLVYVVWKLGWEDIAAAAVRASPLWLLAAAALFFASCVLGVAQWQILLRNRGITLPAQRAFDLYFIGMFFNNFVFGMVAGDAVRVAYLKLGNESGRRGFAATFLDRFAGCWALSAFAVVASAWLVGTKGVGAVMWYTVAGLAAAFVLFAAVMAVLVSKRVQAWVFWLLDRLPVPQRPRIRGIIDEMLLEAHDWHILLPVGVISMVVQALRIGVHVLCAAALGLVSLGNLHYFFIVVPFLAMTMVIPLPFGIREAAEGSLFAMAGFQPEAAMVMGFLASVVGIAVSLVGAVRFVAGRVRTGRGSV